MLFQRIQNYSLECLHHIFPLFPFSWAGPEGWCMEVPRRAWGWERRKVKVSGVKHKAEPALGANALGRYNFSVIISYI